MGFFHPALPIIVNIDIDRDRDIIKQHIREIWYLKNGKASPGKQRFWAKKRIFTILSEK
jgi:hypothetical protein